MRFFFRVFAYTMRYPWMALGTLFCAITGTLMVAIFPAVTQQVIDQVLLHRLDLGVLVAFLVLTRYLYEPVERLHSLNQLFQAGRAASERLFSIMDEPIEEQIIDTSPTPASITSGDVKFRHVSFSYQAALPVLSDISFHARPGEMIALVGPTGSGKTSLVNILSRFYEATVLVLERGKIIERGKHQELLDQQGLYARLYHEALRVEK